MDRQTAAAARKDCSATRLSCRSSLNASGYAAAETRPATRNKAQQLSSGWNFLGTKYERGMLAEVAEQVLASEAFATDRTVCEPVADDLCEQVGPFHKRMECERNVV